MAMHYPSQPFYLYGQPQWPEDVKPALTEDDESSVLDDQVLDSSTPADMTAAEESRRPSITKLEDDYPAAAHVWQERPHAGVPPVRHFSQSSVSFSSSQGPFFGHVHTAGAGFLAAQQSWPLSARGSEASTPTPFFGAVQDTFGQQGQYTGGPVSFAGFSQQEPASAVSMSPQSSQGGWASTTSSDAAESGPSLRHSRYRPTSPAMVLRSDGIRKKNAKFEIPKERNLHTIDALIMQSTDENEKKELKQQKRLLRNRQAALDSRLRKKQNAEKLEADKKLLTSQKSELEDAVAQLETSFDHEREQWMLERQQYEHFMQRASYERDEAIRTKTLETGELRRMNNILKERLRDLERQHHARSYAANASDGFSNDYTHFRSLDLDDSWEDEFSMINSDDLKMDEPDSLQRQATPRPATSNQTSASTNATKSLDIKVNAAFSWETFYMCLLSGAFIMSQAGSKAASVASSAAVVTSNIPTMPDEYRAEAGNVLQAVLASGPGGTHEILPSRPAPGVDNPFGSTLSHTDFARMGPHSSQTSLENLHSSLTTPSRHQQDAAAFSLSAASYNHITNADGAFDNDDDNIEVKPTRLQQLFSAMQAERDGMEKLSGFGSKARERSILLDRVPEKVLRDFREMIARVE